MLRARRLRCDPEGRRLEPSGCSFLRCSLELYVFTVGARACSWPRSTCAFATSARSGSSPRSSCSSPRAIFYPIGILPELGSEGRIPEPVRPGHAGHPPRDTRGVERPERRHGGHRLRRAWADGSSRLPIARARLPRRARCSSAARAGTSRRGSEWRRRSRSSDVSKTFRIPHEQRTYLKEYFLHPFRRTTYERNEALQDVTFSVEAGEFFGVIGPERQRQEHAAAGSSPASTSRTRASFA